MFVIGLVMLTLGAFLVYGAQRIIGLIPGKEENSVIVIKLLGFLCAVIGVLLLFEGEIPSYLNFLRIL